MINKKTLAVTALALLLSQQSFASEESGFYFGGGYHGQFFNSTSPLKVKIRSSGATSDATEANKVSINDRDAEQTKGQAIGEYKPNYSPPFSTNIKLGYSGEFNNNTYRAELEGMYSLVKVDNRGLAESQMTIGYIKKNDQSADERYGMILNNDQIENASVMINAYHHWKNDRFSFSPYVGAGVGVTRMKMFEQAQYRPAYQVKAGLDYSMTEDTKVHIGYRHFGAVSVSELKNLETLKWNAEFDNGTGKPKGKFEKQEAGAGKVDTTIQNSFFGTHGVEVGLTVHFASRA